MAGLGVRPVSADAGRRRSTDQMPAGVEPAARASSRTPVLVGRRRRSPPIVPSKGRAISRDAAVAAEPAQPADAAVHDAAGRGRRGRGASDLDHQRALRHDLGGLGERRCCARRSSACGRAACLCWPAGRASPPSMSSVGDLVVEVGDRLPVRLAGDGIGERRDEAAPLRPHVGQRQHGVARTREGEHDGHLDAVVVDAAGSGRASSGSDRRPGRCRGDGSAPGCRDSARACRPRR